MSKIQAALEMQKSVSSIESSGKKTVNSMLNSMLDSDGYRKRFDELLGRRAPQFVSSIISLVNADLKLQKAFYESPQTIIQSALKAATFDLPIEPALGYAYIIPFEKSYKDNDGNWNKRAEAIFVLGYKGMNQLALRTGVYKTINVLDVRAGELKHYNRLTEEIELKFIDDEEQREKLEIIGWVGYYKLINGTEKTIYMTRKQIEAHERKNRKGTSIGKGWRENFEDMALKTVYRRLIGKWGLMSIDYQKADNATLAAAEAIARGTLDDTDILPSMEPDFVVTDSEGLEETNSGTFSNEGEESDRC